MSIKPITPEELNEHLTHAPNAIIINVLSHEMFAKQHIPGSVNVPFDKIEEYMPVLTTKNQQLILYCHDEECQASPNAAKELAKIGYQDILDLEVGIEGWKEAGYPVESYA